MGLCSAAVEKYEQSESAKNFSGTARRIKSLYTCDTESAALLRELMFYCVNRLRTESGLRLGYSLCLGFERDIKSFVRSVSLVHAPENSFRTQH